jgi:hypothetical protein
MAQLMYVEILDGRYAGQMRDMEPGVALDLINLGRARAFQRPTPAAPPLPGGYRGTSSAEIEPEAPIVVARVDEPSDKPYVAFDAVEKKPVTLAAKGKKK